MAQPIKCTFNLFQEGRTYTGHHRNYILENAIKVCYDPSTREKIRLREALGYLGHGRRELSGRLALPEVGAIKLPDGSAVITENVPANVTTQFEVHKDGTVEHTQEILETAPGKIVSGLNASRVGGFSWACGGFDGGVGGKTKLTDFHGFDYVMNPGFAANRGYILESASRADNDMILENIVKTTGLAEKEAEKWLKHWTATAIMENAVLQDRLEEQAILEDALREQVETQTQQLERVQRQLKLAESVEQHRRKMIMEAAQKSVVAVPGHVLESMLALANEDDFYKLTAFFESAGRVDLSTLPLPGQAREQRVISAPAKEKTAPEYGSAAAAVEFD